jgi:hypothetical protein
MFRRIAISGNFGRNCLMNQFQASGWIMRGSECDSNSDRGELRSGSKKDQQNQSHELRVFL